MEVSSHYLKRITDKNRLLRSSCETKSTVNSKLSICQALHFFLREIKRALLHLLSKHFLFLEQRRNNPNLVHDNVDRFA